MRSHTGYKTLTTLVGVDATDDLHIGSGVPPIDSIDQWQVLMKPNATEEDSVRTEIPLAFCPVSYRFDVSCLSTVVA